MMPKKVNDPDLISRVFLFSNLEEEEEEEEEEGEEEEEEEEKRWEWGCQ